jgi:transposase InsO family protein
VVTDITEHPTGEGKLYLCAVKDCYSNKIVGYSIASHMRASLAVSALRNAIALRDPRGTVVHSDRGAQFRSVAYRCLCRRWHEGARKEPLAATRPGGATGAVFVTPFRRHGAGAPVLPQLPVGS